MALTNASLTQGSSVTNTNNVVTGTGVFDDLMESVTAHLEAQFQLGRITGTDFATVYLGAIQSALQASVTYALGQEKTNAEVALLTQKQTTEFVQILFTDLTPLLVGDSSTTSSCTSVALCNSSIIAANLYLFFPCRLSTEDEIRLNLALNCLPFFLKM